MEKQNVKSSLLWFSENAKTDKVLDESFQSPCGFRTKVSNFLCSHSLAQNQKINK